MTVNVNTDIEENIRKVDELIQKLDALNDKSSIIRFITVEEFAKLRKCGISTAQKIFRRKKLPLRKLSAKTM